MRITIIGSGYVGLVTGACLAETGNTVVCMDNDVERVRCLIAGMIPFHEPGLAPLVAKNLAEGRLTFTTDLKMAVEHARIIFLAVGTPARPNGEADMSAVEAAAGAVGAQMDGPKVIVTKSTVPVGTAERVKALVAEKTTHHFAVVSNPEFLKEGAAVQDFMSPDRVILGGDDPEALALLRAMYAPFMRREDRILVMDTASAELTKYAANAMLAVRISFMNEMAGLCERVGANVGHLRHGVGADSRIGVIPVPGTGFGFVLSEGPGRAAPFGRARPRSAHGPSGSGRQPDAETGALAQDSPRIRGFPRRSDVRRVGPRLQTRYRRHARGPGDRDHRRPPGARCRGSRDRSGRDLSRA
jgi:UDPglucose 6-dehydrogenase